MIEEKYEMGKKGLLFSLEDLNIEWAETHTQVPIPMWNSSGDLRIYFNTRKNGKTYPTYVELDRYTFEIKKINREPLLNLGRPGTFDDSGVMLSHVVEVGDKLYMYYIGWNRQVDVSYHNSIGLAISVDGGNTFHRYSEGPILDRSVHDPIFTASPHVIRLGENEWRMYYLSCVEWLLDFGRKMEPVYNIRYCVSSDGINWKIPEKNICIEGDNESISQPWVVKSKDKFHMWYSYRKVFDYRDNIHNSYRIGYALSNDGINWMRHDDSVGIDVSSSGWDSEMIAYSSIIRKDDKFIMFYNGNGFGQSGVGRAELIEDNM